MAGRALARAPMASLDRLVEVVTDQATCGRCGVYRHLHPVMGCKGGPRPSFWWDRHFLWRHVAGSLWLALPEKRRWDVVIWWHERRPHLCWCDLVDCAYLDVKADDYRKPHGCAWDIPLPFDVGEPRYGSCYCQPDTKAKS